MYSVIDADEGSLKQDQDQVLVRDGVTRKVAARRDLSELWRVH